jgi:hypothetical protein
MPKKVNDELADPYRRDITAVIPACIVTKQEVDPTWSDIQGSWREVPSLPYSLYYEETIDLSGYANQYLTFFIDGAITQEHPVRSLTGSEAAGMYDATVITTVPLDIDEYLQDIIFETSPGMPDVVGTGTSLNPETVLYSRIHVSLADTATPSSTGILRPIDVGQLGTLESTAADKLFVYRIVFPVASVAQGIGFTTMLAPAQRIILQGTMAEEPTIEYMMRLKRSYELANQV